MLRSFVKQSAGIRGRVKFNVPRFASTLAFIETTKEGTVSPSSLSALSAAEKLGQPVTALLLGNEAKKAVDYLKSNLKCSNLEKIILSSDESFDNYLPEIVSPTVVDLLKNDKFSHFVISSSSVGKNVLPRISALLDYQPICDITEIKDPNTFVRPIYAGNIISTIECTQDKKLISVRASAFDKIPQGTTENVEVEEITTNASELKPQIEWVSANIVKSDRPDLGTASRVIAGGRALKDKETFENLLNPLASKLNAAIGATRAAVDTGFCDNSLQVGQTGKVVAPELYIAVGVSGAIQHLAGMKNSKVIVAINNDPDAPIFKASDIGIVGDLYEIIPELTEKL
ncbi:hypothetical protein Kpol_467p10 [Vanderwaltozyma polyspora DSM 70294]|uniref:Probable electron transfer flavoprotein subunit alpha n=1 Tax=Vanderwaltozyma polyspora (strain ATCC 22028 / DSM 70294 / BCRC 21397 / CBS 2163 / NBRC 10782 / NRRL Y-8283 / UCD 57-17) TaxID=436907 RepID=A7TQF4_VANPO|nr:uncharacterized protein Kpol_467p10 [Vanderwaltozyma polyspora DSM 70294]EDO15498.1 hypothetical protein Kpol_467p10 [Vanderwaltozyma polyspora DSM 70294]